MEVQQVPVDSTMETITLVQLNTATEVSGWVTSRQETSHKEEAQLQVVAIQPKSLSLILLSNKEAVVAAVAVEVVVSRESLASLVECSSYRTLCNLLTIQQNQCKLNQQDLYQPCQSQSSTT